MKQYVIKRILTDFFVLFSVSILLYSICRMMPGDYVENMIAGNQNITKEMEVRMREAYGLDKDVVEGYISWFCDAIRGDFGISFVYQKPVTEIILENMAPTVFLAGIAFIIQFLIAIPFGLLSARYQYSVLDYIIVTLAILSISLPSFFIAAVLKRVFSIELGILPISGMITARANYVGIEYFLDLARHFVLPIVVLVITGVGSRLKYIRMNMLEVLNTDYVCMAKAKGLPECIVLWKHAFRNTLIPIVTMIGSMIPSLFSGAVVIEALFGLKGLGQIALNAVYMGDIPYLMGFSMFIAYMTLLGTLVSDILYVVVDPRVSYERKHYE